MALVYDEMGNCIGATGASQEGCGIPGLLLPH